MRCLKKTNECNKFALILLDIMMPSMNGFEACELIRSIDGYQDVPIIFISAISEELHREEVRTAQVSCFMMKPINGTKLIKFVKKILAK